MKSNLKSLDAYRIQQKQRDTPSVTLEAIHDIRSPLEALRNECLKLQSPDLALSALSQVGVLLEEIKSNELIEKKEQFSALTIIEKVAEEIEANKDISINVIKTKSAAFAQIEGDAHIFKRIIKNLLQNALEALTGDQPQIDIYLHIQASTLKIDIVDNGKGIPKPIIKDVFNPGFSFGKKSGNGIGLYTAQKYITKWNGSISIQSQMNQGTRVILKLPAIQEQDPKSPTELILIDDDPNTRQLWKRYCEQKGKNLLTLTPYNFEKVFKYDKTLPIYIDLKLNDEIDGIQLADFLYKKGFNNLHLTTAIYNDIKEKPAFIKSISSKFPKSIA